MCNANKLHYLIKKNPPPLLRQTGMCWHSYRPFTWGLYELRYVRWYCQNFRWTIPQIEFENCWTGAITSEKPDYGRGEGVFVSQWNNHNCRGASGKMDFFVFSFPRGSVLCSWIMLMSVVTLPLWMGLVTAMVQLIYRAPTRIRGWNSVPNQTVKGLHGQLLVEVWVGVYIYSFHGMYTIYYKLVIITIL